MFQSKPGGDERHGHVKKLHLAGGNHDMQQRICVRDILLRLRVMHQGDAMLKVRVVQSREKRVEHLRVASRKSLKEHVIVWFQLAASDGTGI